MTHNTLTIHLLYTLQYKLHAWHNTQKFTPEVSDIPTERKGGMRTVYLHVHFPIHSDGDRGSFHKQSLR